MIKNGLAISLSLAVLVDAASASDAYVAKSANFSPPNPANGQTVTWNGAVGPVGGLTFGTNAFSTVVEGVAAAGDGDTVFIAEGSYDEGGAILIDHEIKLIGDGADRSLVNGTTSNRVFDIAPGNFDVVFDSLGIQNGFAPFSENVENDSGGGIRNRSTGKIAVIRCAITSCAAFHGGGIYNASGSLDIAFSTFEGNQSTDSGGGIFVSGGTSLLSNCTLSGNIASNQGGAIQSESAILSLRNCTVAGNGASFLGGGIYVEGIPVNVSNCIIAGNGLPSGGPDVYGAVVSNGANFIGDTTESTGFTGTDQTFASTSTVLSGVVDPFLADNGGGTRTHALVEDGPAVDAGNSGDVPSGVITDQRGAGFPRISGSAVDIGAFEVVFDLVPPVTAYVDAAVDFVITTDNGVAGVLDAGDVVTWQGISVGPVPNLVFAVDAFSTIQDALEVLEDKGTVYVATGNYVEGSEFVIDRNMAIRGDGQLLTVISGSNEHRIFDIAPGVYDVEFSDLKIEDGRDAEGDGGGIRNRSTGMISLNDCTFEGCRASGGGAFANLSDGGVDVTGCTFFLNRCDGDGAAIASGSSGFVNVTRSEFSNNVADFDGGAISNSSSAGVTIYDSTLTNNFGGNTGGAVSNASGGSVYIDRTLISGNASFDGGAIFNLGGMDVFNSTVANNDVFDGRGAGLYNSGDLRIAKSTLSGNTAFNSGGVGAGIFNEGDGDLTVSNSTLSGNTASAAGGGIFNEAGGVARVFNCTITRNHAKFITEAKSPIPRGATFGGTGGGIFNGAGTQFTVNNSIIAGNTAEDQSPDVHGPDFSSNGANFIGADDSSGSLFETAGDKTFSSTDTEIFEVIETPLADNGGPTSTHALVAGSPAINRGKSSDVPQDIDDANENENTTDPAPFDQRGDGFARISGAAIDIGAFERQEDNPPVIMLSGDEALNIECGVETFSDPGASANDDEDGDISNDIFLGGGVVDDSMPGTYVITYNVTDSGGNDAVEVTRTVTVRDTQPPVIMLNGDDPISLPYGTPYSEPGASAADACDGNVSAAIVIDDRALNENLSGSYPVTYNVNDASGNAASQVTRTVIVEDSPPVLDPVGDRSVDELMELAFASTATIPGAPSAIPVFRLDPGTSGAVPSGAAIDPTSGEFSWTPGEADGGGSFTFDIVVERDDEGSLTDRETFTITVDDVNVEPVLDPIGDQTVAEATTLTFTATAGDADVPADTLTFTLDAASEGLGMTMDPSSGAFSWTPSVIQGPARYPVTVSVSDNADLALTDSETFTIDVTGNLESTITSLVASDGVVFFDDRVDFTVNVNASPSVGAEPGGDVRLIIEEGKSSTTLATATLVNGVAVFTNLVFPNENGVIDIVAQYEGDRIFESSSDGVSLQVVPYRYGIDDVTLDEGDAGSTDFVFDVTRELAPGYSGNTSVAFSVTGSDAMADDFSGGSFPSGSLDFTGIETSGSVTIPISGDGEFEADETFTVLLEEGIDIVTTSATGEITNDDEHRVTFTGGARIHEPDSDSDSPPAVEVNPDILLSRNGTFGDLPVSVRIENSSLAVYGSDFNVAPGAFSGSPLMATVTIPDGASEAYLTIAPIDDPAAEADEPVSFSIVPREAYQIDSPTASLVIAQNDYGVTNVGDFDAFLDPDGGEGTLRQAIINAKAGLFQWMPGKGGPIAYFQEPVITFLPALTGDIFLVDGPLFLDTTDFTIQGPGSGRIAVDAGGGSRVLVASDGEGSPSFHVSGLTLRNGFTTEAGGAIFNEEMLALSKCVISESFAYNGGGIANEGNMTLTECRVLQNLATVYGGGIDNFGGDCRLIDSTISSNNADFGAGIENSSGGVLQVDNSTIDRNIAALSGGGIDSFSATTLISNSTVALNEADFGGGLFNERSEQIVLQSTIAENSAETSVGGILNSSGVPVGTTLLHNTIVAGNQENGNPSDISTANPSFVNVLPESGNNMVGSAGTAGGIVHGVNGNRVGLMGAGDRPFASILAPLGDHGGPTEVYPLAFGSPAADAGNNAFALSSDGNVLEYDQRNAGFTRIVGSTVDIGAYERDPDGFAIVFFAYVPGTEAAIRWSSEPGVSYDVLRSTDLKTWTAVHSISAPSTLTEWKDMSPPAGQAFYVIRRNAF